MSDKETKKSAASTSTDAGKRQVQQAFDVANDQGFWGDEVDPTPNHAYTIEGVVAGEATPETDADAAVKARKAAGYR